MSRRRSDPAVRGFRRRSLEHDGMVEVVSCLERDGRPVFRDLRWGVYAVVKAPNDYARTCFKEYGLKTDARGCTPLRLCVIDIGTHNLGRINLRGAQRTACIGLVDDPVNFQSQRARQRLRLLFRLLLAAHRSHPRGGRRPCPYHPAGRWSPRTLRGHLRSSNELTLLPPVNPPRLENRCSLRHSSRKRPLKLSTNSFCWGLPGVM